jgi:hypothetical protein
MMSRKVETQATESAWKRQGLFPLNQSLFTDPFIALNENKKHDRFWTSRLDRSFTLDQISRSKSAQRCNLIILGDGDDATRKLSEFRVLDERISGRQKQQ